MRASPGSALVVALPLAFTLASPLRAQTLEIQTEVEAQLWFLRWLDWAESLEGRAAIGVFAVVAVLLLAVIAWRRRTRRGKRERVG